MRYRRHMIWVVVVGVAALPVGLSLAQEEVSPQSQVGYCPPAAEADQHFLDTGEDYKPVIRCPSPGVRHQELPGGGVFPAPDPIDRLQPLPLDQPEAQRIDDPTDSPNILICKVPDEPGFTGVHVASVDPIPASVKTCQDYRDHIEGGFPDVSR